MFGSKQSVRASIECSWFRASTMTSAPINEGSKDGGRELRRDVRQLLSDLNRGSIIIPD
jgi:hypothetical protein